MKGTFSLKAFDKSDVITLRHDITLSTENARVMKRYLMMNVFPINRCSLWEPLSTPVECESYCIGSASLTVLKSRINMWAQCLENWDLHLFFHFHNPLGMRVKQALVQHFISICIWDMMKCDLSFWNSPPPLSIMQGSVPWLRLLGNFWNLKSI